MDGQLTLRDLQTVLRRARSYAASKARPGQIFYIRMRMHTDAAGIPEDRLPAGAPGRFSPDTTTNLVLEAYLHPNQIEHAFDIANELEQATIDKVDLLVVTFSAMIDKLLRP